MSANSADIDKGAPFSLGRIGRQFQLFVDTIEATSPEDRAGAVDTLYSWLYRIILEYDLTLPKNTDLSFELSGFLAFARTNRSEFSSDAQENLRYADQWMPIGVMRDLLGNDAVANLRNIKEYSGTVDARVNAWESTLLAQSQRATDLEKALSRYEQGFNFVGLHQGFDDLSRAKKVELNWLRASMGITGVLALLPVSVEIGLVYSHLATLDTVRWGLIASAVPVVTLTLLLIYFFRLAVRSADAAKSQLLQIELRKTLCRFIQSYVDYARQLKKEGTEPLAKFESIVFSGIVSTEEKIPATFDGMDQITGLLKAAKG